jgi:metallo-beta-lactamase family protein
MAVDVTNIYGKFRNYADAETRAMIDSHEPPLRFPTLTLVRTAEESKRINDLKQPAVIMASSGMCTAGRIKHHLRQNLGRPESTILFVGHQGQGTLGRIILEGKPIVRIHGQEVKVRAKVAQIYGFSGHADHDGLLKWISAFQSHPRRLFLTHGEEQVALKLADEIRQLRGMPVEVPYYQEEFDLG